MSPSRPRAVPDEPLGQVYVVGEVEEPRGPVKIGVTRRMGSRTGRAGLSSGNWRQLEVLHRWIVPLDVVRWTELSIHRNLRGYHRRGEWFDVRPLASSLGGWQALLEAAATANLPESDPWTLRKGSHAVVSVRRTHRGGPRRFAVECRCGVKFDGGEGRSVETALVSFATDHLGIDPADPGVLDIKGWRMARPSKLPSDGTKP